MRTVALEVSRIKTSTALPPEKKLSVTYRVEPGCLGPTGEDKIDAFCDYAQDDIQHLDSDYIHWYIVPRRDKTLPEMQYNVVGKRINHTQAEKYLARLGKDLDEFEMHLSDKLTALIESFMEE